MTTRINSIAVNSMAANGSYVYSGFRMRPWHENAIKKKSMVWGGCVNFMGHFILKNKSMIYNAHKHCVIYSNVYVVFIANFK